MNCLFELSKGFRGAKLVNFHVQTVKRRSAVPLTRDYIGAEAARLSALDEAPEWHLGREANVAVALEIMRRNRGEVPREADKI